MTTFTEPNNLKDFLVWEEERGKSRKEVTFLSGETISLAEVVGKVAISCPTIGTADESNTGDGTCASVTAGAKAKIGTYTLTCVSVDTGITTITVPTTGTVSGTGNGTMTDVADGGNAIAGDYVATCIDATVSGSEVFEVIDPNGNMLDNATVGVAYSTDQIDFTINDGDTDFIVGDTITVETTSSTADHDSGTFSVVDPDGFSLPNAQADSAYTNENINFTLADGDTDFAVGDIFTIEIVAGSGKYVEVDASAVDGSQNAAGIAIDAYDASEADKAGVIINNDAIITTSNLVWPTGATAGQKAAWLADLAKLNIFERGES